MIADSNARLTRAPRTPLPGACLGIAAALLAAHVTCCLTAAPAPRVDPPRRAQMALRLDPNLANAADLQLLPGIGPKLAQNIITFREASADAPAFRAADDLDGVPRIGPRTVERLRPFLRFPDEVLPPRRQSDSP